MNISENHYRNVRSNMMGASSVTAQSAAHSQNFLDSLAQLTAAKGNGSMALSSVSGEDRAELLRQLKDPSGDFFQKMRLATWRIAREKEEEEKEQEALDALMEIIDGLTGREDGGKRSDMTGLVLGREEDQDPREPASAQMLAYLASLGSRDTLRLAEKSETEAERVRESSERAVERTLPEERAASLAERYDPHRMDQKEFVEFMDTLAAEGALTPEDAEGIKNAGRWTVKVTEWRLEDGNGRVIDSGTSWTPPGRMDSSSPMGRWLLPCLYDGGEDDGDVLAWARLGCRGAYAGGFQALVDILTRMESAREPAEEPDTNLKEVERA